MLWGWSLVPGSSNILRRAFSRGRRLAYWRVQGAIKDWEPCQRFDSAARSQIKAMNDLRFRLKAMWSINFLAKLRGACVCVKGAPPELGRPVSLGSQLAAHRVKTAIQRHETHQSSLLGACVVAICRDVSRLGDSLESLPPDLQQVILNALIASGQLTDSTVRLFQGVPFFEIRLSHYPGVVDTWLPTFTAAQMIHVDVSGCSAVRLRTVACSALNLVLVHALLSETNLRLWRRTHADVDRQTKPQSAYPYNCQESARARFTRPLRPPCHVSCQSAFLNSWSADSAVDVQDKDCTHCCL